MAAETQQAGAAVCRARERVMGDDAFARMVAAYGALLERLITDTSEALPSAFPGMSVVHRQGDERPQDAEVMVDLRLVPGRPLDGEVFLRTVGQQASLL